MKSFTLQPRQKWIILLVLAFLLRLAAAAYWDHQYGGELFFGDSETYWKLGKRIAAGESYEYEGLKIMRMPGYPALLAPLFMLFEGRPPIFLARLESVIFGTLCVAAVGWLASLLFNNRSISFLATAIVAIDPNQVVSSILVLSEAPFSLLMIFQIGCWCKICGHGAVQTENEKKTVGKRFWFWPLMFGLATAGTVYCRPSWLLFAPFLLGYGLVHSLIFRQKPQWLPGALFGMLIFMLAMSPWWIRNYNVSGRFVATTLQGGASLYDGLNPEATGASDMRFVETFREAEKNSPSMDPEKEIFEYRLDERMKRASIEWAKSNPGRVFELVGIKFLRMWNFRPNEPAFSSPPVAFAVAISYIPVLISGLAGACLCFRRGLAFWSLSIPAVYLTLLHVIFVSSLRYRTPAMLGFAILATFFIVTIVRNSPQNRHKSQ